MGSGSSSIRRFVFRAKTWGREGQVDRKLRFIGESRHKVDSKGRVSIPHLFRRVLEAGDPDWVDGKNPQIHIVYGDGKRDFLECFTLRAMDKIHAKIERMPRADKRRLALQRLYVTHAFPTSVDETGRLVLPAKLRDKIGLAGEAFFAGTGEAFEIWKPETYEAVIAEELTADDAFDPDVDASMYLSGDEED